MGKAASIRGGRRADLVTAEDPTEHSANRRATEAIRRKRDCGRNGGNPIEAEDDRESGGPIGSFTSGSNSRAVARSP